MSTSLRTIAAGAFLAPRTRRFPAHEKRGAATHLTHFARELWHCHSSHAFCTGTVALPLISRKTYERCGTATHLTQRARETWRCHTFAASPARGPTPPPQRRAHAWQPPGSARYPRRCGRPRGTAPRTGSARSASPQRASRGSTPQTGRYRISTQNPSP